MSLVTVAEVRRKVRTALTNNDLQTIIDNEEADLVRRLGAHGDGASSVTEIARTEGRNVYLKRPIVSVSSVTEAVYPGGTATTIGSANYYVWPNEGRIELYPSGVWPADAPRRRVVTVTYVPQDDRPLRRQVIIELVRIALEQTIMRSESVAGEFSYQAPDWDVARARQYRRLQFMEV